MGLGLCEVRIAKEQDRVRKPVYYYQGWSRNLGIINILGPVFLGGVSHLIFPLANSTPRSIPKIH